MNLNLTLIMTQNKAFIIKARITTYKSYLHLLGFYNSKYKLYKFVVQVSKYKKNDVQQLDLGITFLISLCL